MEPGHQQRQIIDALSDGSCKTIYALADELQLTTKCVSTAACKLIDRGHVERMERGCYQLSAAALQNPKKIKITSGPRGTRTGLSSPIRKASLKQRAWNSMRIGDVFTIPDLVRSAARTTDKDPTDNLQQYCRLLVRTGYLIELTMRASGTAVTSNGFKRFRMIDDTGPVAPSIRRKHGLQVYDRNTREVRPWVS